MVFCDFAISCMSCSSEVYLLISNFNVQFFFIVFVHLRHVTRDSLQIAFWHLLHMMFCWSFSVIWLTIVFSPYFVLSKVRYLPVGTVLQCICVCCSLWEVSFMHNATLFIGMISCSKSLWHFLHMCSQLNVQVQWCMTVSFGDQSAKSEKSWHHVLAPYGLKLVCPKVAS